MPTSFININTVCNLNRPHIGIFSPPFPNRANSVLFFLIYPVHSAEKGENTGRNI